MSADDLVRQNDGDEGAEDQQAPPVLVPQTIRTGIGGTGVKLVSTLFYSFNFAARAKFKSFFYGIDVNSQYECSIHAVSSFVKMLKC